MRRQRLQLWCIHVRKSTNHDELANIAYDRAHLKYCAVRKAVKEAKVPGYCIARNGIPRSLPLLVCYHNQDSYELHGDGQSCNCLSVAKQALRDISRQMTEQVFTGV